MTVHSVSRFIRSAAGPVLGIFLFLPASIAPAGAALYGLTVGIDDYLGTRNDLEGAVNDANDIAASLHAAGAKEVMTLLDGDASKHGIKQAWDDLVDKASAGDTIVFSYAGHGGQEPEPPGRGQEADGLNENFLLAGFQPRGPGSLERIVDDEIFHWLKRADNKGVRVIFIADSCHSGSMHRSARAEGVKFRNGTFGPLEEDRLTLPPAEAARLREDDYAYVTFVAATSDERRTPEVIIEGEKRGALSWALARALEGRADFNGDGEVTQLELLGYVVPAVHAHVESQQTPQIAPARARATTLFSVAGSVKSAAMPVAADDLLELRVAVEGQTPRTLSGLRSIKVVPAKTRADLIWYEEARNVDHVIGGTVAENVGAAELSGVAVKWAALKWLKSGSALNPVFVSLPNGNKRYAKGEIVKVEIAGARYPYLTLFNLPPDGRVEFFIPDPENKGEDVKDWRADKMSESFKVNDPPFGAEHLVAIFSQDVLSDLHAALRAMKTADQAVPLRAALEQYLENRVYQVGVLDIYTGDAN